MAFNPIAIVEQMGREYWAAAQHSGRWEWVSSAFLGAARVLRQCGWDEAAADARFLSHLASFRAAIEGQGNAPMLF